MAQHGVALVTPKWCDSIMTSQMLSPYPICKVVKGHVQLNTLLLKLPNVPLLSIPCQLGDPDADYNSEGQCLTCRTWGLSRLGPGVWQLSPSIVVNLNLRSVVTALWSSAELHAYVVMRDVPEPAPFVPVLEKPA